MIKHGDHKTRLYKIWRNINYRCNTSTSKDYKSYGAKGIRVVWSTYEQFKKDMGKQHDKLFAINPRISLDRIDTNGNYSKENCRWTDSKTQMNNRNFCVYITYQEKKQTVSQWAEELGIKRFTIYARIRRGLTNPTELLAKPLRTWNL